MRVKNRKDRIDREAEEAKWKRYEPKIVPDGRTYKEHPRWWNELTM